MRQVDTDWQQATISQLPAETNQKGKKGLDLMAIQEALYPNVVK